MCQRGLEAEFSIKEKDRAGAGIERVLGVRCEIEGQDRRVLRKAECFKTKSVIIRVAKNVVVTGCEADGDP